jgi:hypothetical protein
MRSTYLAQSWGDAGQLEKARPAYAKRATMGGFDEDLPRHSLTTRLVLFAGLVLASSLILTIRRVLRIRADWGGSRWAEPRSPAAAGRSSAPARRARCRPVRSRVSFQGATPRRRAGRDRPASQCPTRRARWDGRRASPRDRAHARRARRRRRASRAGLSSARRCSLASATRSARWSRSARVRASRNSAQAPAVRPSRSWHTARFRSVPPTGLRRSLSSSLRQASETRFASRSVFASMNSDVATAFSSEVGSAEASGATKTRDIVATPSIRHARPRRFCPMMVEGIIAVSMSDRVRCLLSWRRAAARSGCTWRSSARDETPRNHARRGTRAR